MAFPIGPTNGQITTVNGLKYIYRSATNSWARLGSAKFTAAASAPSNAAQGDRWYNTGLDILFEFINDGTSNYWVDIQSVGQTGNVISIGDSVLNGNIVVGVNNRYSIGTSVGYLQNIYANTTVSNSVITTSGVFWSSNGIPIAGVPYTVSSTPPSNPSLGDQWYNTSNDILYEYISDGTSSYWVDIQSPTLSGNTSVAALVVTGGADISGNVNIGGNLTVGGKKAVNGPTFIAFIAVAQAIVSNGTQQRVTFGSETFDTDNNFTSSRFTPTVEGYYQLNSTVRIAGTVGTGENMLVIWKNGGEYSRGTNGSGTEIGANFYSMQVSDIAYANGTTDFFEIYIQQGSGGNRDTTAGTNISYFSGVMVRGA